MAQQQNSGGAGKMLPNGMTDLSFGERLEKLEVAKAVLNDYGHLLHAYNSLSKAYKSQISHNGSNTAVDTPINPPTTSSQPPWLLTKRKTSPQDGSRGNTPDSSAGQGDCGTNGQSENKKRACFYFARGICQYGDDCRFAHTTDTPISNGDNIARHLPAADQIIAGQVPVNKHGHRLDVGLREYMYPTPGEWQAYNKRVEEKKVCAALNLKSHCNNPACPYDHTPLPQPALNALRYVLKKNPCPEGGACRDEDCIHGHLCQKPQCKGMIPGSVDRKGPGCRFPRNMHGVDPHVKTMVDADLKEVKNVKEVSVVKEEVQKMKDETPVNVAEPFLLNLMDDFDVADDMDGW